MKKLYGKALDDELAKRREAKDKRLLKKLTITAAATQQGISVPDLISFENGHDVCPHEKYKDMTAGVPIPKILFKICEKCQRPVN